MVTTRELKKYFLASILYCCTRNLNRWPRVMFSPQGVKNSCNLRQLKPRNILKQVSTSQCKRRSSRRSSMVVLSKMSTDGTTNMMIKLLVWEVTSRPASCRTGPPRLLRQVRHIGRGSRRQETHWRTVWRPPSPALGYRQPQVTSTTPFRRDATYSEMSRPQSTLCILLRVVLARLSRTANPYKWQKSIKCNKTHNYDDDDDDGGGGGGGGNENHMGRFTKIYLKIGVK